MQLLSLVNRLVCTPYGSFSCMMITERNIAIGNKSDNSPKPSDCVWQDDQKKCWRVCLFAQESAYFVVFHIQSFCASFSCGLVCLLLYFMAECAVMIISAVCCVWQFSIYSDSCCCSGTRLGKLNDGVGICIIRWVYSSKAKHSCSVSNPLNHHHLLLVFYSFDVHTHWLAGFVTCEYLTWESPLFLIKSIWNSFGSLRGTITY